MPIWMTLEECLLICRHYESLQWHINTVSPTGETRVMDGLTRQCPKSKSRSNSNTRKPQQAVCPDKPKTECIACGTLHQVRECPATSSVCFKCNKQGHFSRLCQSTTISTPSSNRNTRGSWHSRGRGSNRSNRGCGSKCAVYAELKHRRTKKVATDEISVVPIQTLGNLTFEPEPKPLVLQGSQLECNIDDVQWESCEDILPINSYIASHTVPMEIADPLDWSFDVHLIEIDNVHTDVVYSNIELNRIVLKAKQDTRAQINVLSKTVFQTLQKNDGKLPLFPKTCVKLVGYGNKTINYLGTTKIKCNHNGTEIDAILCITDVPDTKIILGLQLCIDLGLIVIRYDNECRCKNVQVAETSSSTPIENIQRSDDQCSTLTLPPVPLSQR